MYELAKSPVPGYPTVQEQAHLACVLVHGTLLA